MPQLAGREQIIAGKALVDARNVLAEMFAQIDSCMNGAGRPRAIKFSNQLLKFPVLPQKFPVSSGQGTRA